MASAIFWMLVGAAICFVGMHFYHNAKFQEALKEEVNKARIAMDDARAGLKKRL